MITDLIENFFAGKIQGEELFQAILKHSPWYALTHKDDKVDRLVFHEDHEQQYMLLFSSLDYLNDYFKNISYNSDKTHIAPTKLENKNAAVFLEIFKQPIDFFDIDPGTEFSIHYTKDQFDLLKQAALSLSA
jgi:hypothetical protein